MKITRPQSTTDPAVRDLVDTLIDDWHCERPDLDAQAMAVVGRILNLGRRLETRATHALKPFELDYSELDVLATLRRNGPPFRLAPTELARAALITSGAMTACLTRLEKRDLIARARDVDDRRRYWVVLTPHGKHLVDRAINERFREAEEAISGFDGQERRQLAHLLAKLMAKMSE